jgi:hypothetical protein
MFRSFNYVICSSQDIRRDPQRDLSRRFEINDQLKLDGLLDWQLGGIGAFQDLVNMTGGTPK